MEYEKILEQNNDQMIEALQAVLRFCSEQAEPVTTAEGEVYPFGQGVQDAFESVLALGHQMGFETFDADHYGGHIEWKGTGKPVLNENGETLRYEEPRVMAILGHLDVVPAAGGWTFDPYGGEVRDGIIYGRGTTDDKGPVISCLFAMKALKDAGFVPQDTIRLILGLDEETGWVGMDHYFSQVEKPDYGITPDADFPLVNGEKGIMVFEFAKKFAKSQVKGLELRSLKGGTAANSVPDACRAVVRNQKDADYSQIKEMAASFREKTGYKLYAKGIGKSLELTAAGVNAHGAQPHLGLNAVSVMMQFLGKLNFVSDDQNDFIAFYNDYIGFNLNGEKLGIDFEDQKSGKLVFNVGIAEMDPEAGKLTINVRYPVTMTAEPVYEGFSEVLEKYNFGLVKIKDQPPIFKDTDSPMVKLLVDIYRKHTGDYETEPMVIGGGTYARAADNILAYGAAFPGDPDLMHQKDECLSVERLKQMTKIYAEAIYKLTSRDYNI